MTTSTQKKLSPQAAKVLDLLTTTSGLTQTIAVAVYQVGSITARIAELRRAGYEIATERRHDGFGKQYVRYVLKRTPTEVARENG